MTKVKAPTLNLQTLLIGWVEWQKYSGFHFNPPYKMIHFNYVTVCEILFRCFDLIQNHPLNALNLC